VDSCTPFFVVDEISFIVISIVATELPKAAYLIILSLAAVFASTYPVNHSIAVFITKFVDLSPEFGSTWIKNRFLFSYYLILHFSYHYIKFYPNSRLNLRPRICYFFSERLCYHVSYPSHFLYIFSLYNFTFVKSIKLIANLKFKF